MSVTKVTRKQQPRGQAPKRTGLAFAWNATTPRIELVSGRVASVANVSIVQRGPFVAADCSTGQRNIEWDNFIPILTSNEGGAGDFTVIVLANPSPAGVISHVLAQKNDAAGAPFSQITMLANASNTASGSSGNFSFFLYDSSGVGVTDTGGVDGKWHVWVGRRKGTAHEIWRDGVLRGTTTSAVLNISQLTTRYLAIGSRGNGTTDAYGGDVAAALGYNLALPDEELRGLTPETIWRLWPKRNVPRPSTFTASAGRTTTFSLSAAVQQAQTAAAGITAGIQATPTASASIAAAVQQAQTATASLNLAVQQARTATAALDVAVQASATSSASIDAALQLARTATSVLDLAVQVATSQTASIDAQIQAASSLTASISAQVQAGSSVSLSLGAAVLAQAAAAAGVDLAVQTSRSATLGASAALQQAVTAAAAVDLAVQLARSAGVGINAQVQSGTSALASIDAAVQFAALATSTVTAAVAQAATAQLVMNAAVSLQQSLQAAIDAAVIGARSAGGSISAYVDDGTQPTFDGLVFRTARGTSTTRAVKGAARNSIRGYQ